MPQYCACASRHTVVCSVLCVCLQCESQQHLQSSVEVCNARYFLCGLPSETKLSTLQLEGLICDSTAHHSLGSIGVLSLPHLARKIKYNEAPKVQCLGEEA